MWLANLFYDLEDIFYDIEYKFWYVGYWLENNGWPSGLANLFYDIADFFDAAWRKSRDIGREIEDWWDTISQTASDLNSLWNYAYGWITDKINEAINDAAAAYTKAIDALSAAAGALALAVNIRDYQLPDIYLWVKNIPAEINDFVTAKIDAIEIPDAGTVLRWAFEQLGISEHWMPDLNRFETLWDSIFNAIFQYLGITRKAGEEYWDAFWRTITEHASIPSWDDIMAAIFGRLGIIMSEGETWWDALWHKIEINLPEIIPPELPTWEDIIAHVFSLLGITKLAGDTWWDALWRKITDNLPEIIPPEIPTWEDIIAHVFSLLGITKYPDETWWTALWRKIKTQVEDMVIPLLPTWDQFWDKILEYLNVEVLPGETAWEAWIRKIITSIPGIAGVVNFWNIFWDDLNKFFNDPWDWLEAKFTDWFLGPEQ